MRAAFGLEIFRRNLLNKSLLFFVCAYILSLFALDSENFRIPLALAIGKRDGLAVENLTKFTAV